MFERYTYKARRVIFFARYEASQYRSPKIDTEHLLLGLFREYKQLLQLLPDGAAAAIRAQIDALPKGPKKIPTSVDLPLTNQAKRVLCYAAEEADRLTHRWIGPEHLVLGLLREKDGLAAGMLESRGLEAVKLREHFAKTLNQPLPKPSPLHRGLPTTIHGLAWNAETIRERVKDLRLFNWHWHKTPWKARDVAVDSQGKISFDLSLLEDKKTFTRSPGAWKKDHCAICRWELSESADNPEHCTGYTNGRDWVCQECYEKFLRGPDYFATAYPDIT